MPDTIPEPILVPRRRSRRRTAAPSARTRSSSHDRGIYIESWLPERRSRRKPLLFVHGELAGSWVWERYLGYFAGRGWEGHALNLRNHYWSQTADPATLSFDTYTEDVVAALDRLGPTTVVVGHGMGGLLALKAAERMRDLRPGPAQLRSCRATCGRRPGRTSCARSPRSTAGALIGWETLPEKLLRDDRDLTLADVLRIQHLLGQKPHEAGAARRQMLAGVPVDRAGCRGGAAAGHRRRARPDRPRSTSRSAWPSGSTPSTSRSGRTRTTAWSSARAATSRSPRRSGRSSRRNRL